MADFDEPTIDTAYTLYSQVIREVIGTVALWFDGTSDSNIPTGAKGWDATNRRFMEYSGSAWGALLDMSNASIPYNIRVAVANSADACTGNAATSSACTGNAATASLANNSTNLGGVAASSYTQNSDIRGVAYGGTGASTVEGARTNLDVAQIPSGTRMFFYQASAPTGWTIVSGLGDRLLAVGTYNSASSGNTSGSWQQTGHSLTSSELASHNHSATTNNDGSHSNYIPYASSGGGSLFQAVNSSIFLTTDAPTTDTNHVVWPGGPSTHDHTITVGSTGAGDAHNHGDTWRPAAVVGLIASRN